jgi:hypothetical protein
MEVRDEIREAIDEAVKAGAYRAAERLNPSSARVWSALAEPHSRRVAALTDNRGRHSDAVKRPSGFS